MLDFIVTEVASVLAAVAIIFIGFFILNLFDQARHRRMWNAAINRIEKD